LRTKTKIALAHLAQRVVMAARFLAGRGYEVTCRRGGIDWHLDLREGIDFSIYILGAFERDAIRSYPGIVHPGDIVLDIGANIGAHALPLAACAGEEGLVVAVEPTQYAYNRLRDQIRLNPKLSKRLIARQAMLMGTPSAPLADSIPSSWPLDTPPDAHGEHAGVAKSTAGAVVTTVDELVSDLELPRVSVIKLDVDGYELEVLRGGRSTLEKFGPTIVFEHTPYTLIEKGYRPSEMLDLLLGMGYRFASLDGSATEDQGRALPDVATGASTIIVARKS
jgi:FkbM family methyltransferase